MARGLSPGLLRRSWGWHKRLPPCGGQDRLRRGIRVDMAEVIGIGACLEPAVDDMRRGVELNLVVLHVGTKVMSVLFGELDSYIAHERMGAGLDEFRIVFVQHLLMHESGVFGLSSERRGQKRHLNGEKGHQHDGGGDCHTGPRIRRLDREKQPVDQDVAGAERAEQTQ